MANTTVSPSTKNIIAEEFENVKTMFEGFNTERKLTYSDTDGGEYGSGDPSTHGSFAVFVTVPDLNLNDDANRGFLGIGNPFARHVLAEQLYRDGRLGSNFIKLFTNVALNAPFQDISVDTTEVSENWDGVKLVIAKDAVNSTQGGTVNLRLRELDGNPVLNTLAMWVNYTINVTKGMLTPSKYNVDNRVLDYASTIYVFGLAPDNTTIEYAAKYTGCFPTAIPAGAGNNSLGEAHGAVELDCPFTFNFYESMTGVILEDFNRSSKHQLTGESDLSMATAIGSRGELLGNHAYLKFKGSIPYITTEKGASSGTRASATSSVNDILTGVNSPTNAKNTGLSTNGTGNSGAPASKSYTTSSSVKEENGIKITSRSGSSGGSYTTTGIFG